MKQYLLIHKICLKRNIIFRILILAFFSGFFWTSTLAEPIAKKRRPPNRRNGKNVDREIRLIHGDAFIGVGVNFASGEYFDYQEQYYNTTNPSFLFNGEFTKNSAQLNFGGQVRVYPFKDNNGGLAMLGFVVGGSFIQRSFSHKFVLFNNALPYQDESTLTEEFGSSHFLGQFMVRFGYRFFGELGISNNFFLSGYRKQSLSRFASGNQAFGGGFDANSSNNFNLTSDVMATNNLGWCFGVGYQIHKFVGVRLFGYFDSRYFKENPNLSHFQPSIQALISY
jgi:hypothetical protein